MPRSVSSLPARGRVAVAALAAAGAVAALPAAADASAAKVRIARPTTHVHRARKVVFLAVTSRRATRVRFYVDGHLKWTERHAPYRYGGDKGTLNLRRLRRGRHRLTVTAQFGRRWVRAQPVIVPGGKPAAVAAAVTGAVASAAGAPQRPAQQAQAQAPAPAAAVSAAAPTRPSNVVFDGDFSTGNLLQWDLVQDVSDERIQVVPAPGGRGGLAGRFEVRNGDHVNGETDSRSEVLTHQVEFGEGDAYEFDWSTYFPTDFPSVPSNLWQDIVQWHNQGSGTPPLQFNLDGEKLCTSGGTQINFARPWCTPLVRGVWHDFSVKIKFSSDPNVGWLDITYDGQHVLDHYAMATLYPGLTNYLKQGYFRAAAIQPTGVVYHAGMQVVRL